ncbi:hypothetical protein [Ectopseudomonas alcaliphila]|uniref:Uncharacterized protein n=1 Tax=Ectopseudomonas alcaliphila TaxID=101564 RepID=A0ABU4PUX9_9GAMM|nr:hypothetical protein [Pseudomonas alcaliphila]MDX5991742.1 hypothetical protein [Pseudomonas alcaliphila]
MKEDSIKQAVSDFYNSGESRYQKEFSISGKSDEFITVTIKRTKLVMANESLSFEARANTVSALPSGSSCGCCGGSGRSS